MLLQRQLTLLMLTDAATGTNGADMGSKDTMPLAFLNCSMLPMQPVIQEGKEFVSLKPISA